MNKQDLAAYLKILSDEFLLASKKRKEEIVQELISSYFFIRLPPMFIEYIEEDLDPAFLIYKENEYYIISNCHYLAENLDRINLKILLSRFSEKQKIDLIDILYEKHLEDSYLDTHDLLERLFFVILPLDFVSIYLTQSRELLRELAKGRVNFDAVCKE